MTEMAAYDFSKSRPHVLGAIAWCRENPHLLFDQHLAKLKFVAVHQKHGVVLSADNLEDFEAALNDKRPSVLKQLFLTHTDLWVSRPTKKGALG